MAHRAPEELVKTPYEEVLCDFDLTKRLKEGETIGLFSEQNITVVPSDVTVVNVAVLTPRVQVKLAGGAAGGEYEVNGKLVTSLQKLEVQGALKVRNP
jgi:hypothetical protein